MTRAKRSSDATGLVVRRPAGPVGRAVTAARDLTSPTGFVVVACVVIASLAAACTEPTARPERPAAALVGSGSDVEVPTCLDCKCEGDCDAETGWVCPSGACNAAGTCACDPATAATDCPSTGCCDAVIDLDGQPMYDGAGAPVYECVTPVCTSDSECSNGEVCLSGATCGRSACGCPDGQGPDPDQPCCLTVNALGVCCTSGVDGAGRCVCPDPLVDLGHGCQCPAGTVADDSGACVCEDPHAAFDAELGSCACVEGYGFDFDPYSGEATCLADDEDPIACPDPHAVIDPATGQCECQPGFVLGDTLETITAQCVPASCGDGWCGPGETCGLCSYDCGACDDDAEYPDAEYPGAEYPDAGVPMPDAGLPDAVPTPVDAGLPIPFDAAQLPTFDAGQLPPFDAGPLPPFDAGPLPPFDAGPPPPTPCFPPSALRCRVDLPARR